MNSDGRVDGGRTLFTSNTVCRRLLHTVLEVNSDGRVESDDGRGRVEVNVSNVWSCCVVVVAVFVGGTVFVVLHYM